MGATGKDQIRGWKEIASYLGRDERTVKRWERDRGLPVRRIPGPGRANVYLVLSEVEAWLAVGRLSSSSIEQEMERISEHEPSHSHAIVAVHADRQEPLESSGPAFTVATGSAERAPAKLPFRLVFLSSISAGLIVLAAALARGHILSGRTEPLVDRILHLRPVASLSNTRANALYLEGVYFQEQRTPASLDQALHFFQSALAEDPRDAPACAGMATTYLLMREYGSMPQREAYAQAEIAARRAVALDPKLAEAHATLGFIAFFSSWDPHQAEREFVAALRLDPFSAVAHHWYGSMLTHQGLYPEALEQLDAAQRLEPTSAAILASKAYALGLSGHREEAIALLQPLVASNSDSPPPHRTIADLSLLEPRDIPRYLAETEHFAQMRNDLDTLNRLRLASDAYRRDGEAAMWTVMLQNERRLHPSPTQPTYFMVDAQAALGQQDGAIRDISILARDHDPDMIGIGIDPLLDPLRHNPEFRRIEAAVGVRPPS